MSYRAPGRTDDEARQKIEQDIRYLYKCCEGRGGSGEFEVVASSPTNEAIDLSFSTGRWFSRGGQSTLIEVFASIHFTTSADFVLGIEVTGVVVDQLVIAAFDNTGQVTLSPAVTLGATGWIRFFVVDGSVETLTVQARLAGPICGSAGLNFVRTPPE